MANFTDSLEALQRQFLCAAMQSEEDGTRWLNSAIRSLPGSRARPLTPEDRAPYELARARACQTQDGPGNPLTIQYPANAGAVPGACATQYRVYAILNYTSSSGVDRTKRIGGQASYTGPLLPLELEVTNRPEVKVYVTDDNGTRVLLGSELIASGSTPTASAAHERIDGLPDNCGGDPNADPAPTGSGNMPYEDENGDPQNPPFTIVGGRPRRTPSGDTIVPTDVCFGDTCFRVDYSTSTGDQSTNSGGGPGAGDCCPPVSDPPNDDDPGEDEPPEPEDEVRYVGVLVTIPSVPTSGQWTELGDGVGPSLFVPRLAVLRFAVEIGRSRAWTVDIPIKQRRQFIPVNGPFLAYAWHVLPDANMQVNVIGVPVE